MAVFEVLSEVIGSEELLGLVALPKLVDAGKVIDALRPVWLGVVWKLFSAIAACIAHRPSCALRTGRGARVEGGLVAGNGRARPGVSSKVERILMALGLIFVLEAIVAELARILLLHLMGSQLVL